MTTHSIDSPAVEAARLTGRRRAFLSFLSDADYQYVRAQRGEVYLTADGLIDWKRGPLSGDVTAYGRAEVALGGAA